ncbi:MAG: hypothetical protein M3Q49_22175, partial [Actinomycetota bacterium]|nr:hypothetical protein [Actinomycetota bacterium]
VPTNAETNTEDGLVVSVLPADFDTSVKIPTYLLALCEVDIVLRHGNVRIYLMDYVWNFLFELRRTP